MPTIQKKIPKQDRSKALVKSILEAASKQLLAQGMKNLTTNHIARQAGVNIGSLYQYFNDKESIVARLIEMHVEEEIARISAVVTEIVESSQANNDVLINKKNIRLIIKEFIDIHTENLQLTQILHMQVSHVTCRKVLRNATHFFTKLIQKLLDSEGSSKNKDNFTRAYIITNSIDSLIQTTLIERPKLFVKPIFLDELVDLSMRYLTNPSTDSL